MSYSISPVTGCFENPISAVTQHFMCPPLLAPFYPFDPPFTALVDCGGHQLPPPGKLDLRRLPVDWYNPSATETPFVGVFVAVANNPAFASYTFEASFQETANCPRFTSGPTE